MRLRDAIGFAAVLWVSAGLSLAQGTKLWSVGRYEEMERGTPEGVAISSEGELMAGPALRPVYTAEANFLWSVAAGREGVSYVGLGGATAGSAAVMRVGADGRAVKVFSGPEMQVQAIRVGADGTVYVATSPGGKVYRLGTGAGAATVVFDPSETAEKPNYLWDLAIGGKGELYVAAGAPAAVYRVAASGKEGVRGRAELLFRTADQHMRSLLLGRDGTMLWAGSDGEGVIYRFETERAGARPFAAYAAAKREITSLAMDGAGNVYAAGVGNKGPVSAPGLPPLPVTGALGVTVTFAQPGSAGSAGANSVVPDGSEVYRIAVDGTPSRIGVFREDVVYGLAFRGGRLYAATGNRGRVYAIDPELPGSFADVAHVGATQVTAMAEGEGGLLLGTSNGGKVYRMGDGRAAGATYTSEVFDAGGYAQWGRVEAQYQAADFRLEARSGNVPSPVTGWSDWSPVKVNAGPSGVPAGRYAQWRALLGEGGRLEAVGLNYLGKNAAPVVDEVVVATGARVTAGGVGTQPATVQMLLPSAAGVSQVIGLVQEGAGTGPLTAQKDRTGVTVRWAAHDDNGDDLMFAVWYRGEGETVWRQLKDKISERFYSFDAALVPDGSYRMKVVASDGPVHVDADTLTGERVSAAFTVDTTPPVPGVLEARLEGGRIRATFEARDALSPIAHAEYSVDAGAWHYMEPVGGLSDSLGERYALSVAVAGGGEHVLAVRVYDRFENMASVKAVVR